MELMCALVEYGGNLDACLGPHYKGSLLLRATHLGNVKLVKLLLERGADPNHPDKKLSLYKQGKYCCNPKYRYLLFKVKKHGREYL
jgi:ankyrin repeat protein